MFFLLGISTDTFFGVVGRRGNLGTGKSSECPLNCDQTQFEIDYKVIGFIWAPWPGRNLLGPEGCFGWSFAPSRFYLKMARLFLINNGKAHLKANVSHKSYARIKERNNKFSYFRPRNHLLQLPSSPPPPTNLSHIRKMNSSRNFVPNYYKNATFQSYLLLFQI